jgi:ubiquinone/menaquinone biosynthesis C-methylase UbiE
MPEPSETGPDSGGPTHPLTAERFEDSWRSRFKEFAEDRDDDAGIAGWSRTGLDARVRRFVGLWKAPAVGGQWLDAGCGAGTYSRILSRHGISVIGADYSFPTLLKAKRRSADPIAYAVTDVRYLPFRNDSFDGALCFGVTQALARSDEAVRALASVVRPGGQVWIDALNRACLVHVLAALRRGINGQPMHLRYESPAALKRLMRAHGLERVRLHWLPILPARLQRFQGWLETPPARWVFRFVPCVGLLVSHSFIVSAEKPASAHRP